MRTIVVTTLYFFHKCHWMITWFGCYLVLAHEICILSYVYTPLQWLRSQKNRLILEGLLVVHLILISLLVGIDDSFFCYSFRILTPHNIIFNNIILSNKFTILFVFLLKNLKENKSISLLWQLLQINMVNYIILIISTAYYIDIILSYFSWLYRSTFLDLLESNT